jgi:hypothetical protein
MSFRLFFDLRIFLSSLQDSHTARHIFEKLLKGPLLENRTVVSSVILLKILPI